MNVEEVNGSSAWLRLHGEEFKKIPFGALVDFKPSEARGEKREKFEPRGETGIFAGYVLSTGMHWANKYRAWALTAFAGAELNIKKAKVPPRLRMPHQTGRMILKSPLTFPIQQKYQAANETLEGIEISVDALGLDARDRLIEDEDYEPELLHSDEKRLLDDEVDQIAGLLLEEGPELHVGDRGDHVGEEDARPSSSKGKGDGHAKDDEEVVKSDLPHVSAGLPGDGITYVNDDGREVKIDKAGRPCPVWEGWLQVDEDDETSRIYSRRMAGRSSRTCFLGLFFWVLFLDRKPWFFRVRVLCQNNPFFGSVFLPKILGGGGRGGRGGRILGCALTPRWLELDLRCCDKIPGYMRAPTLGFVGMFYSIMDAVGYMSWLIHSGHDSTDDMSNCYIYRVSLHTSQVLQRVYEKNISIFNRGYIGLVLQLHEHHTWIMTEVERNTSAFFRISGDTRNL